MANNLTRVAFVYIEQDDKILLLQEGGKLAYGLWCLPGGHLEIGELFEEAAIREVLEETGYHVNLQKIIHKSVLSVAEYKGSKNDSEKIELIIFKGAINDGELTRDDQALDLKWITKKEAIKLPLRWSFLKDLIIAN